VASVSCCYCYHRYLHSFPTRRSSDLQLKKQMDFTTNRFSKNTTIGAIVTNAQLTKAQANKIASIAHDGLANTIKPSHLFVDGTRSEEHTSELQSRFDLVCRLQLEKKN